MSDPVKADPNEPSEWFQRMNSAACLRCGQYGLHVCPEDPEVGIWRQRAERLWQLLDDVSKLQDTIRWEPCSKLGDMRNRYRYYRFAVDRVARKRYGIAESEDGYTLKWK